jgi:hypothetical protein
MTDINELDDLFPSEKKSKDKQLKNLQKRCQDLERFQVNMSVSLYEKYNPLTDFYTEMLPKTWQN